VSKRFWLIVFAMAVVVAAGIAMKRTRSFDRFADLKPYMVSDKTVIYDESYMRRHGWVGAGVHLPGIERRFITIEGVSGDRVINVLNNVASGPGWSPPTVKWFGTRFYFSAEKGKSEGIDCMDSDPYGTGPLPKGEFMITNSRLLSDWEVGWDRATDLGRGRFAK